MNIELKDIITLSNNIDYIVSGIATLNDRTYYLLVDINDETNFDIFYYDNGDMVINKDKGINDKLLPKFYESLRSDKDVVDILRTLIDE